MTDAAADIDPERMTDAQWRDYVTARLRAGDVKLASSGAGYLFWSGAVSPAIYFTVGNQPKLTTASQISET